jgi:hypothetical protein
MNYIMGNPAFSFFSMYLFNYVRLASSSFKVTYSRELWAFAQGVCSYSQISQLSKHALQVDQSNPLPHEAELQPAKG